MEPICKQAEEVLNRMTAAFEGDVELREELKAELRSHLEEALEEERAADIEEALAQLGPVEEVASDLEAANRRRMKRRALASLVLRGLVLPGSVVLTLVVGWTEGSRVLGFHSPGKFEKWIEEAEEGSLWADIVLGTGESRIYDTDRGKRHWSLIHRYCYNETSPPKGEGKVEGSDERRRLIDLPGYLAAKRADLSGAADRARDWFETFNWAYYMIMQRLPDEGAVDELLDFCEEVDPGNGYYALVLAAWQHREKVSEERRGNEREHSNLGWTPGVEKRSEVANRLFDEALAADRLEVCRLPVPAGSEDPPERRFEDRVQRIGDAIVQRKQWPNHFLSLMDLVRERVSQVQSTGDAEGARRIVSRYVNFLHHLADRVPTPYAALGVKVMVQNTEALDPELIHALEAPQVAWLSRVKGMSRERFHDSEPLKGNARYAESGVLGSWHGLLGTRPDASDARILRRIDYVVAERLAVALYCVLFGAALLGLLVLRLLGPKSQEGVPLRLVLRVRDYGWLLFAGTGLPLLLYLVVNEWTPLGRRDLDASTALHAWVIQFASLAAVILGLNWMLAGAVVRRRFGQLGIGNLTARSHHGSLVVVLIALLVFLLAPMAASEEPGARWWALGLGIALSGLVLGTLLGGGIALLRGNLSPRHQAPDQSAATGVCAVSLALAVVFLGAVISPFLRAEEASLLGRETSLQVDPATGLTRLELRCVEEFRALGEEQDKKVRIRFEGAEGRRRR